MDKVRISKAKSRVGFKVRAVPNVASVKRTLNQWVVNGATVVAAFALVFSSFAPVVNAQVAAPGHTPVAVCHATGNGSYNKIVIDDNGLKGHDNHDGDIVIYADDVNQECPTSPVVEPCSTSGAIVVTPSNTQGWSSTAPLADTRTEGTVSFVADATSPAPGGALSLVTGPTVGIDKAQYMHATDTLLSDVTNLCYYTKQNSASFNNGAPSYQLVVLLDGTIGTFTTFVYEPYNNGFTINPSTWQSWNVAAGTMWSSRNVNAGGNCVVSAGAGGPPFYSLATLKANCPNAVVKAFGVNVGSYNPNYDTEVEFVRFNNDLYNFELDPTVTPKTVTINKVWQDAAGNEVAAPSNKGDITINATSANPASGTVCEYNVDAFECTGTLSITTGTITVTETGLPAGWMADSGVGTGLSPVCTENGCTHTVVNKFKTPAPCGGNIVTNPGFETPTVVNGDGWDAFDSGATGLGWSAKWVTPAGAPATAKVELHRGVNGWNAHGGSQHAELDADWGGPSSGQTGENASVALYQDLPTVVNGQYTVSFWTSPRPGEVAGENQIKVKVGSIDMVVNNVTGVGNGTTVWTQHTYTFTATSAMTRIEFTDMGAGNSLGGFLDDVSVVQDCIVQICKVDNNQNPLPGWTVFLKGPKVDSVTVNATTGANDLSDSLVAGDYVFEASGKYVYRPSDPGASESDAAYSKRLPSDAVYGGPDAPWVRVNNFPVPYTGWLGIQVDEAPFNWGTSFNPSHEYVGMYTSTGGAAKFRILDDNYSDNSGSLTVDIYPIVKGVTGENGCVMLNTTAGEYTLDEIMQDGWSNVTGQGLEVDVDGTNDSFTLVNKCDTGCTSQIEVCKQDIDDNYLSDWTVYLRGKLVETVALNSNNPAGASSVNMLDNGKQYLVKVTGEWQNRGFETVDASNTTPDGWTTVLAAPQGGYPDDLLETQINNQFVNWSSYNTSHEYNTVVTGSGATASFRVYDFENETAANASSGAWFGDNNGSLTVRIYEVASGVTGKKGCVTLQDVPYGTYTLGEIMQDGWTNESGMGDTVILNSPVEETVTLVNECDSEVCEEPVIPKLHLIKVVCDEFSDVAGNELASEYDATNERYLEFSNYPNGVYGVSALINGFVNPSEIPGAGTGCTQAHGWQFLLSTDMSQNDNEQTVTTVSTEYVTPISGDDSTLSPALQAGIRNGNFWVSEIEQDGYDFATIRCYNDALNGDNLEFINIGSDNPTDIYCIAYNVQEIEPCVVEPISVMSDPTKTLFWGLREGSVPPTLTNIGNYPQGAWGNAVAVGPTGYAGAWDGSANESDVSGAVYVSNSATQPTSTGGADFDGSVDSWRLFTHTFTIPAGAVTISAPMLHVAADNSVTAYIDDQLIGTTNSFSSTADFVLPTSLTPGNHTLKFSVKNDAFAEINNPTGLIYKLDTVTFTCDTNNGGGGNGGNTSFKIAGKVYQDENSDNVYNEGEIGLPGWNVNLDKLGDEVAPTNTSTDSNGDYEFVGLVAGCYLVTETPEEGWIQTEPVVDDHSYQVALGGVDNCDEYNEEETLLEEFTSLFINTAHAAAGPQQIAVAGDAIGLNFGNFDDSRGGNGGSGGSGGSGGGSGGGSTPVPPLVVVPTPPGQVLGDTTQTPSGPTPQVLGAVTELPRTGMPLYAYLAFVAILGVLIAPGVALAKRSE